MPRASAASASAPSKAGIIETTNGERHIPSSIRADGTKRKEIKIRPGYRPIEDVEVYKNSTVESWKRRGNGRIPGAEALDEEKTDIAATSTKNVKRREARRKAREIVEQMQEIEGQSVEIKGANGEPPVNDLEAKKEKVIRNIKKKLRQAKDLKDKEERGSTLMPEQALKVAKITELILELEALGFNTDGDSDIQTRESKDHDVRDECPDLLQ